MTNCIKETIEFPKLKTRVIESEFTGGDITSDGGVLLLREADRVLKLTKKIAAVLGDSRRQKSCAHDLLSLIRQRVYAIALGYEDLNDHDTLRQDIAIQTAVNRDEELASASTLCRFENRADRQTAWQIQKILVDQFMASFKEPPSELILDFDATDDPVHGEQEGRFFHGYYDKYCFLPLYVFCNGQLLASYLRPSNIDGAKHSWAILSLLVKRIRRDFPNVRIIFRGDSGFCRFRMLKWCERHDVKYIVGIAQNKRLNHRTEKLFEKAEEDYQETKSKIRRFTDFQYAAKSWNQKRRIIAKIEVNSFGPNHRYVVTNLEGDPKQLYEDVYCARGDMENRIKEQQLCLFAGRTSCQKWWSNQFRLLLSSLAYTLVESIRRMALKNTELEHAYVSTIRLKLLKIGAVLLRNTRRIRFLLSSNYPNQSLFRSVARKLAPG